MVKYLIAFVKALYVVLVAEKNITGDSKEQV
jgi:hypothetical protein